MAFVDDDDAEGVLAIMFGQEAGAIVVIVEAERLVGRDMDAGILGSVLAAGCADDAGIVAAIDVGGDYGPSLAAYRALIEGRYLLLN